MADEPESSSPLDANQKKFTRTRKRRLLRKIVQEEPELLEEIEDSIEPSYSPVAHTMTPENIAQAFAVAEKTIEFERKEMEATRDVQLAGLKADGTGKWIGLLAATLICATILVVILILRDQPDLLKTLIPGLVGVLAGAVGGYGYGFTKGRTSDRED